MGTSQRSLKTRARTRTSSEESSSTCRPPVRLSERQVHHRATGLKNRRGWSPPKIGTVEVKNLSSTRFLQRLRRLQSFSETSPPFSLSLCLSLLSDEDGPPTMDLPGKQLLLCRILRPSGSANTRSTPGEAVLPTSGNGQSSPPIWLRDLHECWCSIAFLGCPSFRQIAAAPWRAGEHHPR